MKLKITFFSLFFSLIAINSAYAHGDYRELFLIVSIVVYFPAICILICLLIATFKVKKFINYIQVAGILCLLGGFYYSSSGNILPIYIPLIDQKDEDHLRVFLFYLLQVLLFSGFWCMRHRKKVNS